MRCLLSQKKLKMEIMRNNIVVDGSIASMFFDGDVVSVFDACLVEELSKYKWCAYKFKISKCRIKYYVSCSIGGKRTAMHRIVVGYNGPNTVDHIDGNSLNNLRSNLRIATSFQNNCNRPFRSDNTSGLRGVHWIKKTMRWSASISQNYKKIHLGCFDTKEDAYREYVKASERYHGEYGWAGRLKREKQFNF